MVEILQRGEKPDNRTYTTTCRHCVSQLRFKASEAKTTFDQRDGDYLTVSCPVCANPVNVAASSYDKTEQYLNTLNSLRAGIHRAKEIW